MIFIYSYVSGTNIADIDYTIKKVTCYILDIIVLIYSRLSSIYPYNINIVISIRLLTVVSYNSKQGLLTKVNT